MIVTGFAASPSILLQRANGTEAAPTATASGDQLGMLGFRGYAGTDFTGRKGALACYAAENWTTAAQGAYLAFETCAIGSTAQAERMRISPEGNVGIGRAPAQTDMHLDVYRASGYAQVNLESGGTGDTGYIVKDANRSYKMGINIAGAGQGKFQIYGMISARTMFSCDDATVALGGTGVVQAIYRLDGGGADPFTATPAGSLSVAYNESTNTLVFRVRYSNNALKSATISLV
jgi:hypothetical protein